MSFFIKQFFFFILVVASINVYALMPNVNLLNPKNDSINIYMNLLNDKSDDLMENHPADDIYKSIWTSEKLNPYLIPIDSLPDSIYINCQNFRLPIAGKVTSDFGPRRYRYHYGTDVELDNGDTIIASFSGKVRIVDYEARGYGHYVVIRHDNGLETVYAHLSQVLVSIDQPIKAGQIVGLGGNTGRSTGPHLHYEIRYLGNAINPANIINFEIGQLRNLNYLITKKKSFYHQRDIKKINLAKYITVNKGDTLSRIALRNGTSIKSLCKLNKIKTTKLLKPGQKIRVR